MFISDTHRLIFFEVPRTASNAVTQALYQIDPDCPTARQRHGNPAFNYHSFQIPKHAQDHRIIAVHRNPYERLWSFWKHRHHIGNPEGFKTLSWPDYVAWVLNPRAMPVISEAMLDIPIAEMENIERVTHWLRYAQLAEDWRELSAELGLPETRLVRKNLSPNHGAMENAYNTELANSVYWRFKADFDRFGYAKDSWQSQAVTATNPGPVNAPDSNVVANACYPAKVVILTPFVQSDPAYSLNRVVQDQLAMFVAHGYAPTVLVIESEHWHTPTDNFALPAVTLVTLPNLQSPANKTLSRVDKIILMQDALAAALVDADVVIAHDLIYLPTLLEMSEAALLCALDKPDLHWLHWIHSATNINELFDAQGRTVGPAQQISNWPKASPVCFNHLSVQRITASFGCPEQAVRVVPHPLDVVRFFNLSEYATRIYESARLYQADFICALPARLDRGKQVEWAIRVMARMKAAGQTVRLLVIDFHSQGEAKHAYRDDLKAIAVQWGLEGKELIFLSEFDELSKHHSPQSLVRELFQLSNIFIFASRSESYSLSTQEAAVAGNLLILNEDFTPMREIYGENALYFKFSSNIDRSNNGEGITSSNYQDVSCLSKPIAYADQHLYQQNGLWFIKGDALFADHIAAKIRFEFASNKVLAQRQFRMRQRNIYTVFKRYLEPILY